MKKAVVYARFSSSGQQETSIEFQIKDCTEFAKKQGYVVIKTFEDRAKSATTDNRPSFRDMIAYCSDHKVDAVICWKRDRFARNRYDSAIYKQKLKENGTKLLYSQESNIETADGIITDAMMEAIAEWYSVNLSNNIRKGNSVCASKYQTLGSPVFGYKTGEDKTYVIDEETAPVVRKIFEDYANGKRISDIMAEYPQYHFKRNKLDGMLSNVKYYGRYKQYGIDEEGVIPPIVSKELFDRVQEMKQRRKHSPNLKEDDYILTGKLFCGECGQPMVACGSNHENKTYRYYCCVGKKKHTCTQSRITKEYAEVTILNRLKEIIQDDKVINEIADKFLEWQAKEVGSTSIKEMEQEKKTLQTKVNRIWDIMIDTGRNDVYEKIPPLEERIAQLDEDIDRARGKVFTREEILAYLKDFRICYDEKEWNRELIRNFLVKAYYCKDRFILQTDVADYPLPCEDISILEDLVDISGRKLKFLFGRCYFMAK